MSSERGLLGVAELTSSRPPLTRKGGVHVGQIISVPPETPHKFSNTGDGSLRQLDIHLNERFITIWLED